MPRSHLGVGTLVGLVLLALLPRLPLLLAPRDDLFGPGLRPGQGMYVGEELHRGTTALHWMHGTVMPVADYQFVSFHGGPMVTSLLAVPLFAVLGPNLVALKATGLVFHVLAVLLLFLVARRLGGARAGALAAVLLAGAAPGYALLNVVAYGTHVEGVVFTLGTLLAYLRHLERPTRGRAFLVGLCAGLGTWFAYTVLLGVGVVGAHALLTRRRGAAPGLLGALVGFTPWLWLGAAGGWQGLRIYGGLGGPGSAQPGSPEGSLERMLDLAVHGWARAPWYGGPAAGALDALHALLMLLGLLLLAGLPRRGALAPAWLLLAPAGFLVVFAVTRFAVGHPEHEVVAYRYVYVLYPFAVLGLALAAAELSRRGPGPRRLAGAGVLALAGLGCAGSLAHVDPGRAGRDLETPGFDSRAMGRFVALRLVLRPEALERAWRLSFQRLGDDEGDAFRTGLLHTLRQLAELEPEDAARPEFRRRAGAAPAALERLGGRAAARFRPAAAGFRPAAAGFRPAAAGSPPAAARALPAGGRRRPREIDGRAPDGPRGVPKEVPPARPGG